jgi:hypothetical protein
MRAPYVFALEWIVRVIGLTIAVGIVLGVWASGSPEIATGLAYFGGVVVFIGAALSLFSRVEILVKHTIDKATDATLKTTDATNETTDATNETTDATD